MVGRMQERFQCRSWFLKTLARCSHRRGESTAQIEEGHRNAYKGFCIFLSTASGEGQGRPAMSSAGGALHHQRRGTLAAQRPRRRMLSPGNPCACHIHQQQQQIHCRTDRLLQHPSAKRGACGCAVEVPGLCWVLMRSPI